MLLFSLSWFRDKCLFDLENEFKSEWSLPKKKQTKTTRIVWKIVFARFRRSPFELLYWRLSPLSSKNQKHSNS